MAKVRDCSGFTVRRRAKFSTRGFLRCGRKGTSHGHIPNAGAELYSLRDAATLVMFPMVFSVAVTATMSCHVGSHPGPCGKSVSGGCQSSFPQHTF